MNVLDALACEVVACSNHAGNRPYAAVAPWDVRALYFNANGDDAIFERDHEAIAGECDQRGLAFCVWLNVPRTFSAGAGKAFAERASALVEHYGGAARVHAVMLDNEKVPLALQDEFWPRWDQLRPWRPTLTSVEPIQDESVNRYARMLARNASGARVRKVTFQCYQGGMQPLKPLDVRTAQFGVARLADDELCPTIDPAQPRPYIASATACALRGLMLFESGRLG